MAEMTLMKWFSTSMPAVIDVILFNASLNF